MALNMSLFKKIFIKNWDSTSEDNRFKIDLRLGNTKINTDQAEYVIERIGEWHNANAIHQWFVNNIQNGKDDGKEYNFTATKANQLIYACQRVLEKPELAIQLLPSLADPLSVSRFGNAAYDDLYFIKLEQTINICNTLLAKADNNSTFYYQGSW